MSATPPQPSLESDVPSYPLPAYLRFCPGGISCSKSSSKDDWYDLASYSHSTSTTSGPSTPRSTRRRVLAPDDVVSKARQADDRLRQFTLLHGKDTTLPRFLPSLSVLAEAAFAPLTGVPPSAARKWADALVLQYLDDAGTQEVIPSSEEDIYSTVLPTKPSVNDAVVSVLKRLLEQAKEEHEADLSTHSGGSSRTRPCGYVFQRGDIAWNCRTCQTDSTCVLCDSCFRNSNHEGHEVFFHRTTPGGCCDCGDAEAWKAEGCCSRHRPQQPDQDTDMALLDETEEAVRMALRGRQEGLETLTSAPTALPPRLTAALGVVIGAAVRCLVQATNGSGIGADPIQWKLKWADDASRVWNGAPYDENYFVKTPTITPQALLSGQRQLSFPHGYRLHLRLHNDDVHTFDEVIEALHEPRHARRNPTGESPLVTHRDDADELTHHVDADGQVVAKSYTNTASALQGYRRLKSRGLHCAVVASSQVDLEQRARALAAWLTDVSAAHPAAAVLVVQALVQITTDDLGGVFVWNKAHMIPSWAGLADEGDEAQACRRRFQAFPPHLASSYVTREESERLHKLGLELNAAQFVEVTGTDPNFYADVPYRLPSDRYCKSPHALWGTLPSLYMDTTPPSAKHPLLHRLVSGLNDAAAITMENRLTEDVLVVDTDLRKQQEADRITSSVYPHKLPGLNLISGLGTVSLGSLDKSPPPLPNPMEWRHLLSTCSFRAPVSPILLLLLLDPYPTKQLRAGLHALVLSLLVDSRFKCRFAAALGGVAYRPLSTLFCAGVGTEADSPLGFTVQIFTAGSLVRAMGNATATEKLLRSDNVKDSDVGGSPVGIFTVPIGHTVVRCIHTNLLGATKEVHMILNNTAAGNDDDSQDDPASYNSRNDSLLPALTYCAGEHPLTTPLPAAPDDGFLDSRSTRHKRLPHLLRDLEYVIETPGTAIRLLLPQKFPIHPMLSSPSQDAITFSTVWARLLRLAQGMDPQKRKISGGHVEYEQNRWLEAFGLSLNFAGTRDALAESPTNSSSAAYAPVSEDGSHLVSIRDAMGNLFAALLRELKLWLYREGMLETGLPLPPGGTHGGMDLSQVEALQRSTLHVSSAGIPQAVEGAPDNGTVGGSNVNAVALACATGVKMTETQLEVIESALRMEDAQHQHRMVSADSGSPYQNAPRSGPVMGDWLRVPHSPLAGDSLSFHLPLHRALAKSVRSMCSVVVPEAVRSTNPRGWWKLPVLDEDYGPSSLEPNSARHQHPLVAIIRPTLRSSNCRVVWSAGPDCSPADAQRRRSRSKSVSAAIASAKIIHSIADHPIRCLAAAQQIECHLWARNGSSTAGMALNYSSAPLCRSFRDLDLTLVQLSAAGLSIGLGARRVFALLISRFSMDGYLCDPERRVQGGTAPTSGGGASTYGAGAGLWVNPPRLQDPDHAIALSESFFLTLCLLVTEMPPPPPISPSDDTALRNSIRRELLHTLAVEPRSHSEAMAAAQSAVSRRDESDSNAGSSGGGGVFREVFADVLRDIATRKNLGSSRTSGPPGFELRADCCHEYDPTFFHLRRQDHQHAMDNVARLRRQKTGVSTGSSNGADAICLPIVCAPPKAHPRFIPCRLLLHLQPMDAAICRSLLFALTGGSWLPPSQPQPPSSENGEEAGPPSDDGDSAAAVTSTSSQFSGSGGVSIPMTTFSRRAQFMRSSKSSFGKSSQNDGGETPPFSPAIVMSSSVSFIEVLQLLTLQVHTLEECAALHRTQPDLDDDAKSLSASLSINSYLGRLIRVPDGLIDVWALRPFPDGPLPSKGSGANRGSLLGLLIAIYEHRADHGTKDTSGGGSDSAQGDDGHGGARTLAASGLKWLLRFVNALVDGAPSVSAASQSATSGIPIRASAGPSVVMGTSDVASWTIDASIRTAVSGMLKDLPDLWPKEDTTLPPGNEEKPNAKSREARKAAQRRVMEMMKKKQMAFAESMGDSAMGNSGAKKLVDGDEDEADLCIICRCDDVDGENNGPLGYLGHVQRSRATQMRATTEASGLSFAERGQDDLFRTYRVVGDRGCQLRASETMDSAPGACLPMGSIVTVLKSKVSDKCDLLSRRVLVRHVVPKTASSEKKVTEGWASMQSSQGYVILSPLATLCFTNSRWGSTRPVIRQCGHAAHLQCVETHTLSLHQRAAGEQPYDGRFAANLDDGEFLCPLCKQLSNILIPKDLTSRGTSGSVSEVLSVTEEEACHELVPSDTQPRTSSLSSPVMQSLRKLLTLGADSSHFKMTNADKTGTKALSEFGAHLLQAMDVPWERTTAAKKRQQRRWHPGIRRWDYEQEEGEPFSAHAGPCVKNVLRLLRQQHVAWAAVGHSAASAEASSRGVEESLAFGVFSRTNDPWADYSAQTRDSNPMLLELKRTLSATSGLFEVLTAEMRNQLGSDAFSSNEDAVSVVGSCLADILDGRSWMLGVPSAPDVDEGSNSLLIQWSELTALLSSLPCHTARDGMISQRHEARAAAAAMWTVKGLGTNENCTAGTSEDTAGTATNPPAPLAIKEVYSVGAPTPPQLPSQWGTMDPFLVKAAGSESGSLFRPEKPFRPSVASAFLYLPLLSWDMNTLAGAVFSTMLANDSDDLPESDDLLQASRLLLIGRMIQAIVTPCGYDVSHSNGEDDEDYWTQDEIQREGLSLAEIVADCAMVLKSQSLDFAANGTVRKQAHGVESDRLLGAVGRAILPFARSLILVLRACTSVIRQRQRKNRQGRNDEKLSSSDKLLDDLLDNSEVMTYEDGFRILQLMGGPLPSQLGKDSSSATDYFSWWALINRWLANVVGLELHHGSRGKTVISQIGSTPTRTVRAEDSQVDRTPSTVSQSSIEKVSVHASSAGPSSEAVALSYEAVTEGSNLNMFVAREHTGDDSGDGEDDVSEDEDMEDAEELGGTEIVPAGNINIRIFNGHELLIGDDELDDSDDDMIEEMEVDAEDETVGFFEQALADASLGLRRNTASADVFADSSEDNSSSGSDGGDQQDRGYACVSRSPILPYQPSLLGLQEIGPGPRGAKFEFASASAVMCDLSHLGMIHRKDSPTFCLIGLPRSFVELYSIVNLVKGRNTPGATDDTDDVGTSETAICLLTGAVMRSGSARRAYSRAARPPGACTLHARKVGSGSGIFFLVQKCTVLLMHNNKSAYSASLYVDEHGEEDPGLRRGRPLFLSEARYRALETLWRQQGIPREVAQIRSTSDRVIRDNWY